MPDYVIGVLEGDFTFDLDLVSSTIRDRWPSAPFVPATGRRATLSLGQFQIPDADAFPSLALVSVDVEGKSLTVDSARDDLASEVIAAATHVPGFPSDGSVVLAEWSSDFQPLRPAMTTEDVLALPR